ncbi:MAG: TonB-dependent receptor plug domain-containing protein, partial [Treponemataceae bacterium]|nr:TonB-dependent receptor plug domain-containing protein [Treponemataceae bacterium]
MKKQHIILSLILCILICAPENLFSEAVYDSNGRILRSSTWMQGSKKKTEESESIQDVVQEDETSEPALQDQSPMQETSLQADKCYTSQDIEKSAASSLPDFLQEKGFLILSSGGSGTKTEVSYKGFTSFCIRVYVDGVYANSPTTGEFDWNSIAIDSIESIVISEVPQLGV